MPEKETIPKEPDFLKNLSDSEKKEWHSRRKKSEMAINDFKKAEQLWKNLSKTINQENRKRHLKNESKQVWADVAIALTGHESTTLYETLEWADRITDAFMERFK